MSNKASITDQTVDSPSVATKVEPKTYNPWQMPLMIYASWWSAMTAPFWLPRVGQSHVPHHDPHEQLIVPDAVAAEGVQSLFA